MSKILIDEATVKLALEASEPLVRRAAPYGELDWLNGCKAITALREALTDPDYKALCEKAAQQYNDLAELVAEQPAQQELKERT